MPALSSVAPREGRMSLTLITRFETMVPGSLRGLVSV
jgi:hypothetical protein